MTFGVILILFTMFSFVHVTSCTCTAHTESVARSFPAHPQYPSLRHGYLSTECSSGDLCRPGDARTILSVEAACTGSAAMRPDHNSRADADADDDCNSYTSAASPLTRSQWQLCRTRRWRHVCRALPRGESRPGVKVTHDRRRGARWEWANETAIAQERLACKIVRAVLHRECAIGERGEHPLALSMFAPLDERRRGGPA